MARLLRAAAAAMAIMLLWSSPSDAQGTSTGTSTGTTTMLPGVYVWGGEIEQGSGVDRFYNSVQYLINQGFHAIRFTVSANAIPGYEIPASACTGNKNLSCYLQIYLNSPVFDNPGLQMLMLTLTDFSGGWSFDPAILASHGPAILNEYMNALATIEARFHGRNIQIVIANWEGDNAVLCGSVAQYKADAAFAAQCEPQILSRMQAFFDLIRIRDHAVALFTKSHPDFNVVNALELNHLHIMDACLTHCLPSYEVVTYLSQKNPMPVCSYSSWGSLFRHSLGTDLDRLLTVCRKVIIGELGFSEVDGNMTVLTRQYATVQSAIATRQSNILATFLWHGFDSPWVQGQGIALYSKTGHPDEVLALPPVLMPTP